jgi:hypothetical protein
MFSQGELAAIGIKAVEAELGLGPLEPDDFRSNRPEI